MKLELKHLAPYLPYGLKFYYDDGHYSTLEALSAVEITLYYSIGWGHGRIGYDNHHNKPILRPLSDLTKEIEHNGQKFVPIEELFQMCYFSIYGYRFDGEFIRGGQYDQFLCLNANEQGYRYGFSLEFPDPFIMTVNGDEMIIPQFEMYGKLFEWHFDVFGLIHAGLAIDINNLK